MSTQKTDEELRKHKKMAISTMEAFLDDLITSNDPGKADKFSYWIEDYVRFLKKESYFKPSSLKRYKRGEIIKAHLGYNIGSEEGGLHYAVVLDRNNSIHNPVITIVPLTSVKNKEVLDKLGNDRIYLGNELYLSVNSKRSIMAKLTAEKLADLRERLNNDQNSGESTASIQTEVDALAKEVDSLNKMGKELSKMKRGSIALIGQITTISKIRIYDPKTSYDVLHNIRLSNEKLDLIDAAIEYLYLGKKK